LKIDAWPVGSFPREALEAGVNLAVLSTPMERQAREVHALTVKRNAVQFSRWRKALVPLHAGHSQRLLAALRALDSMEAELASRQRSAAQPRTHRYELKPVP
jgi:hypothetical protein